MGLNHNFTLTFYKKKPHSEIAEPLVIMYNYGNISKKRKSPVQIPQKTFNKKRQELKKEWREKYTVAHDWIEGFRNQVNDIEVALKEGKIHFEQAFKLLLNDYETELCRDMFPVYAKEKGLFKPSVIKTTMDYLKAIESKFEIAKSEYQDLMFHHLQRPSDIEKIQEFIDNLDIRNKSKKKYMNYLNKLTAVHPTFSKAQKNPFTKQYQHGSSGPKMSVNPKVLKLSIGKIEDNPYALESMLWWLLSFCLRGIDCADILVLDSNKIEGENKGDLRHYFPQMSGNNTEKFYYVGNRTKMEYQDKKSTPLKILFNIYPVLTILKMLKRLVRHLHPNIAYVGKDPVKIYNLNYLNESDKKKWKNRLGTMTENTTKLFGATMKQARTTFSTNLANVLSVSYQNAEKQLSTALGHTNEKTQKFYINPDQIKQDLLQIEVIERFDVRKIVKNIITTCSCYSFKRDSKRIKLVSKKNLQIKHLDIPATVWNWQKELEWSHEKLKSNSDVDTVEVDGKPVQKEIFRPTTRFKELDKERNESKFATFVAPLPETKETLKKIHKEVARMRN